MKNKIIQKDLSYRIVGLLFQVHDNLGRYCRERLYGDTLEELLKNNNIKYKREFPIITNDQKSNFVDFLINNALLIDLKSKPFVTKDDYYQMKRYLELSNLELGLIINFRNKYLMPKRILNPKFKIK